MYKEFSIKMKSTCYSILFETGSSFVAHTMLSEGKHKKHYKRTPHSPARKCSNEPQFLAIAGKHRPACIFYNKHIMKGWTFVIKMEYI
jgi:hypothetical protein